VDSAKLMGVVVSMGGLMGTERENAASLFERLVDTLRLSRLPAAEQIAALPAFVYPPDEVVELYDDAYRLVPLIAESGLLNSEQLALLERLDAVYGEICEPDKVDRLLTLEAMHGAEQWRRSRELADQSLKELGCAPERPSFDGISWVPGSK